MSADPRPAPAVEVRRSPRRRRTVSARREGDTIVVMVPASLDRSSEQAYVDGLVRRVLAREARAGARGDRDLADRAEALCSAFLDPVLGRAPRPTSVTWVDNQTRRWGSCSVAARTIRVSDRVRDLPVWVQDYVLLHELAHLVHADHSAAFRLLVARYPRAEEAKGYLRGWSDARGRPASDADDVD